MLNKFISIKNVGRFKQSASTPNPQLLHNVMVLGANGFGKTTLCAILRSLQTGESAHIAGRETLGSSGGCDIHLMTSAGSIRFGAAGWTATMPQILIFDNTFVAENVHAGDVVELEQKRNLYRVIIGQDGIGLATEDARLASESREKTTAITAAGKGLQTHVPTGMKLDEFLKFAADAEIDTKISEQIKTVEALRQAEQLKSRTALNEFALPALPESLSATLARTIDDIAEDAELQVAAHLAAHQMTGHGEAWLAEGTPFIADGKCPYCGQRLEGLPLIAAYQSLFSDAYNQLKTDIAALRATIERDFGDKVTGQLTTQVATNTAALEFWRRYCTIPPEGLDAPTGLVSALSGLKEAVLDLLDRKAQAPLEPVALATDSGFLEHGAAFGLVHTAVATMNTAIGAANAIIAAKKAATAGGDVNAAVMALNRLSAIKKRHETAVADSCTAYGKLEADKSTIETQKTAARAKLEDHSRKVVKPYERRINALLEDFNAGFSIAETKYAYPGGLPTSSYQLVINDTAVDVGDAKTGLGKPSFKNTLSAGDRTTLALAFFLAHLERDPDRANRVVVFDDPFNSQDAFRRHQTIYQIKKACESCAQVFVLSHDATFLRQVWDKCPTEQRIAIQITDHLALGSKIGPCDLEEACKGRVASEIDDLLLFFNTGAGKTHDIAKKMRVVLETYCRATYPNCFDADDMLGTIAGKVRAAGDQHPAHPLLDSLDQINDYTRDSHHGADPTDGAADQFDQTEMRGYVRRTLKISNNLQA
jgi:wobble nucleotide-excising tRNase